MSRPPADETEVAKLLKAAKGKTPWRIVEAETGVVKSTREGWFRRGDDGTEPPLGQVVYLAVYLGVSPGDLVAAALADYRPPTGSPGAPSDEKDDAPVALDAHRARGARRGRSGQRPARSRIDRSPGEGAQP